MSPVWPDRMALKRTVFLQLPMLSWPSTGRVPGIESYGSPFGKLLPLPDVRQLSESCEGLVADVRLMPSRKESTTFLEDYSSGFTGMSKCAVFTTPLR